MVSGGYGERTEHGAGHRPLYRGARFGAPRLHSHRSVGDRAETSASDTAPAGLSDLLARKELYEGYVKNMEEAGENEVSAVDPDARLMGNNRGGVEVAYNIQSAVDGRHDLILDYHVSKNPSDQNQLGYMVKRVKKLGYRGLPWWRIRAITTVRISKK